MQLYFFETKLPNLKLKTRTKQLIGSLPLVISLPRLVLCLSHARAYSCGVTKMTQTNFLSDFYVDLLYVHS